MIETKCVCDICGEPMVAELRSHRWFLLGNRFTKRVGIFGKEHIADICYDCMKEIKYQVLKRKESNE